MSILMNNKTIYTRKIDPQTKQIEQQSKPGYYPNKHRYNNAESRWCDLNNVPYYRNGLLYGPDLIEDKITGLTYHSIVEHRAKIWRAMAENPKQFKPETFFKVGDKLLIDHFQSQSRFEVTHFSPKAGNMHGTRLLNVDWQFDQERWDQDKETTAFMYGARDYWHTKPVKENQQIDKLARPWSWYAVPKDTYLKFQLLGLT